MKTTRRRRVAICSAGVALLCAAGVWGGSVARSSSSAGSCGASATTTLRLTVGPDLAPALAAALPAAASPATGCAAVRVSIATPESVVEALSNGRIQPPDVWVPDSSLWLQRVRTDRLTSLTGEGTFATSPMVLAVPRGALAQPTIEALAGAAVAGRGVALSLSDQRLSPGRVGAVLALQAALAGRPDARAALAGLLETKPGSLAVLPMPEQTYLSGDRRATLDAVRPGSVGGTYDYPFAVLTADPARRAAAMRLLHRLQSPPAQALLREAGFRTASTLAAAGRLDEADAARAEKLLDAVRQDARLLAVLDVSGSMGTHPAGTPSGATRISLAVAAAAGGLAQYPDSTQVGLWVFADGHVGPRGHREVVPATRLDASPGTRTRLGAALTGIRAVPGADTALYDTVLDAVATMRAGWQPGRVNAVVLLTDGKDTSSKTSLDRLLAALSAGPRERPVPVIAIAYGPDTDVAVLRRIAAAGGGAFYAASDPRQIRSVFLDALAARACRPACPATTPDPPADQPRPDRSPR